MVRLGALAAIAAGPLFVISGVTELAMVTAASAILFALGLVAVQVVQQRFWCATQLIGFGGTMSGFVLMIVGSVLAELGRLATAVSVLEEVAWVALPWGFHVVLPLGLLVYALGSRRSGLLPAWMKGWLGFMAASGVVTVLITALVWSGLASQDQLFPALALVGLPFLLGWSVLGVGILLLNERQRSASRGSRRSVEGLGG